MQKSRISFYFALCAISLIFNTFYSSMKDYTTLLLRSRYFEDLGQKNAPLERLSFSLLENENMISSCMFITPTDNWIGN